MSCPVCFNAGVADDTVRTSINLGVTVMLVVTAVVLAGFLRFVVSIIRRSSVLVDSGFSRTNP
jgi:galactitol-specific phosphotransferase system IIC component